MEKYLKTLELVVPALEGTFLVFFIPLVTLLGCGALFYYGFNGIVLRETISLFSFKRHGVGSRSAIRYEGNTALFFGVFYVVIGVFLAIYLGTLSYMLLFGI